MCRCDNSPVPVAGRSTAPRLLRLWVRIPEGVGVGAWMPFASGVFRRLPLARFQLSGLHKEICRYWDSNQHSLFPKATASSRSTAWATPADSKKGTVR